MPDLATGGGVVVARASADMLMQLLPPALRNDDPAPPGDCPAFKAAPGFLKMLIAGLKIQRIADIGGGAKPMLDLDFLTRHNVRCDVLDISQEELDKAPAGYTKVAVDLCAPPEVFERTVEGGAYDFVFTHMFLEHIEHPEVAHRNIRWMLKPGGLAVHMFPSLANLPLAINMIVPEAVSQRLLALAQPRRDLAGKQAKFPAYYKLCGRPSQTIRRAYARFGFDLVRHKAFIGHTYYSRVPLLRDIEKRLRKPMASVRAPLASYVLVIARRR